jgi:hypothetical protein
MIIDGGGGKGGGEGWLHALLAVVAMKGDENRNGGPEGCPNNLQSAWRLAELFFWSDLSWTRADLCANSYVISTCFSLLSSPPSCTHYICNVGIKTGLNSFQNFPYVTTFSLRSISVFTYEKQSDFGKNWVCQKQLFLDRTILERDPSQKYWTSAILERMEPEENFRIAYYLIYLVKTLGPARFQKEWSLTIFLESLLLHLLNTNTFLANPDQNNFGKNWFRIQFLRSKVLTRLSNSLYILFLQSNIYFH